MCFRSPPIIEPEVELQQKNITTSVVSVKPTPVLSVIPSHSIHTLNVEKPSTLQVQHTNVQTITNILQLEKELQSVAAASLPVSGPPQTPPNTNLSNIESVHQSDIIQEQLSQDIKLEDPPVPEVIDIKEEMLEIPPIIGNTDNSISQVLYPDKQHQLMNSNTETPSSIAVSTQSPSVSTLDKTRKCYRKDSTVAVLPLQSNTVVNSCGTQPDIPTSDKTFIHDVFVNIENVVQNESIPGPSTQPSVM